MLLTKSRIPLVVSIAIIALMGFAFFLIADQAAADPGTGSDRTNKTVPFNSGDTSKVEWNWSVSGQSGKVDVILDASLDGDVFLIEFYVSPTTDTVATHTQRMGDFSAFPTGQVLDLPFSSSTQLTGAESVGIHLHDADDTLIIASDAPAALPAPTPTPVPPAQPTATPVPTVEVPADDITEVAAPAGGAAAVFQPSSGGTITAPDDSITVQVPPVAHDTTFQIAYDPAPDNVPATPSNLSLIKAFGLNAHDADGTGISLDLLKLVTIVVKYTADDAANAPNGSPSNLKLARYDVRTNAWATLNTTVDLGAQTLTAKSGHLSLFAVMGAETTSQPSVTATPTATATAEAPPTGDFAPGSGLLLGLILVGFLLIAAGGTYMAQSRRSELS
jgi:hypothetical protein